MASPPPAAPATEPAAAPPAQSAAPAPIPSLEEAFSPAALSAGSAVAAPAPAAPVSQPVETPAAAEAPEAEASTADAQEVSADSTTETRPKVSRRAELEAERQAELTEARAQWEQERTAREATEAENAGLKAAEAERRSAFVARLGDDAEYKRLSLLTSDVITWDEQQKLDSWKLARTDQDLHDQYATHRYLAEQGRQAQVMSNLPGVNPQAIKDDPSLGGLLKHFHDAGGATARAETQAEMTRLQSEMARLEADNHALRAQAIGGARAPETGGNSPPAGAPANNPNAWNPNATADELIASAFSPAALRRSA